MGFWGFGVLGASLGKSLMNNLNKKSTKKNYVSELHQYEDRKVQKTSLASILEQTSLNEFADLVNLSQKKLEVEKNASLMDPTEVSKHPHLAVFRSVIEEGISRPKYAPLKLPRKPNWTKEMTKEQLISIENKAFLEWRRDVAMMEEGNVNLAITPFEKNLGVWKQLWNVIEKSQLLIQIVDCRNPFFFYSADLERYIKEIEGNKHYLLLLNKADFLDESQIQHWNEYFKEKGVEHIFFSALSERAKMEEIK
jgi:large subunit GTPase 1